MKNKRINGEALEMIMRDVMQGMLCFTHDTCRGSETADMDILSVEETGTTPPAPASNIIPFPRKK